MKVHSMKLALTAAALIAIVASTAVYAMKDYSPMRTPVEFYKGHTHDANGLAIGAPEHSGGLDKLGCHNASVPYHCH
jgi:hypothetical protein